MKSIISAGLSYISLLLVFAVSGCQTAENVPAGFSRNLKTQGVYTTLAATDPELDLPGLNYMTKSVFFPGETPAAVVVGYGNYNQQQKVSLEVIESATGRLLLSKDYYATFGKVVMQPLQIRLSGSYDIKLRSNGTQLDACRFSVVRTNLNGSNPVSSWDARTRYAEGIFSVSIGPGNLPDALSKYDDRLIYTLVYSISKRLESTNSVLFAQRFPGKVAFQCGLDSKGNITSPSILENTLDAECGAFFQKVLEDRSPYDHWPEGAERAVGSDHIAINLTFSLD